MFLASLRNKLMTMKHFAQNRDKSKHGLTAKQQPICSTYSNLNFCAEILNKSLKVAQSLTDAH